MANSTAPRRPTHYIYAVTRREDSDKGFWTRIGAAWPNADGKGFSCRLDLVPINGADILMREPREEELPEGDGQ
jgi:hypothetical protein